MDPIALSQALMRTKSITPEEGGALDVLEAALKPLGFTCHRQRFADVENLYARKGTAAPNLCFAGHVDVVPPGDIAAWKHDPFEPTIEGNVLYGRGASDMKTAIAAWVVAASRCATQGSLSLLITCDEEGVATHGTKMMLEWLEKKGEKIDACIVGEPTNPNQLGEMIKIGRRGSVSFSLTVSGVQGHVAYPEKAANPITPLINLLQELKATELDKGTEFFPPSNLEITSVDVGNPAGNVIPAKAEAKFNIRFNDVHTGAKLVEWVEKLAKKHLHSIYNLQPSISAEAFFCPPKKVAPLVADAVEKVTGKRPEYSTTGGTSDARFIRHYCTELGECGLINETAHKVNESATLDDIRALTDIYEQVIKNYGV
jgi:succinyl-diaminopimelate desuccinylase